MTDLEFYLAMVKPFEKAARLLIQGRREAARKQIEEQTSCMLYERALEWADCSKRTGWEAWCFRFVFESLDGPGFGRKQKIEQYRQQYLELSRNKPSIVVIYRKRYKIDWKEIDAELESVFESPDAINFEASRVLQPVA